MKSAIFLKIIGSSPLQIALFSLPQSMNSRLYFPCDIITQLYFRISLKEIAIPGFDVLGTLEGGFETFSNNNEIKFFNYQGNYVSYRYCCSYA